MREQIFSEIEKIKNELKKLSKDIHDNPETSLMEYKSSSFIKELLLKHGFEIEDKSGGIDTAFKARFKGKSSGPTIAFLAEYDALPNIGHGCGHNLIAAVSTGAAIGLSKFMKDISGEIILMGTPGEEKDGGKIMLIEAGEFDDIDFSLMTHPSTVNLIGRGGLATTNVGIEYTGVSAHSSTPEFGINALQGVIQTFNNIDYIRAQLPIGANINGIITEGGIASNIVPDYAKCEFTVRAKTLKDLDEILKKIKTVIKGVENLTGAKSNISIGTPYAERYPNLVMGEIFKKYMEAQGEIVNYPDPNMKFGSSDIGNVSLIMPSIHEYFKIADDSINSHSVEFTDASISQFAHTMSLKAAKSLACVGYDILTDETLREEILKEFRDTVPKHEKINL